MQTNQRTTCKVHVQAKQGENIYDIIYLANNEIFRVVEFFIVFCHQSLL